MEAKIINILNKIFICLKESSLKKIEDVSNPKILYNIACELDPNIKSKIDIPITGEDNIKIRISELNEISEIYLTILKSSEFIPTDKFNEEIELIDIIGLANKEKNILYNFMLLILITTFSSKKKNFKEKLTKEEITFIYNIINPYMIIPENDIKDIEALSKINDISNKSDYKYKIEQLEKELKLEKERASKIKLFEEQYNNLKNKLSLIESKNTHLIKELMDEKNKVKNLEKIIDEKSNKMGILQNKLDEKIKIIKERDIQLNKEIELNLELKFKLEEINKNKKKEEKQDNNNININNDINKYNDILKLNEELKNENNQLNEIIKVMESKLEEKNEDEIGENINNIRLIEDLEKKIKKYEKEKEDSKIRYEKEFELMASAIYNLGFQFWSLKLEDSEKLKQNENWLVRERIKQYNGDY